MTHHRLPRFSNSRNHVHHDQTTAKYQKANFSTCENAALQPDGPSQRPCTRAKNSRLLKKTRKRVFGFFFKKHKCGGLDDQRLGGPLEATRPPSKDHPKTIPNPSQTPETWLRDPSRSIGFVLQCRLHQKSNLETNSKDISWNRKQPQPLDKFLRNLILGIQAGPGLARPNKSINSGSGEECFVLLS